MSYSITESESYTITHARYVASKVKTDLLRLQRFYGGPSNTRIDNYEAELIAMLKGDYLDTVIYGFKRTGNWIVALKYTSTSGGVLVSDQDPGAIKPGEDIAGASFGSY